MAEVQLQSPEERACKPKIFSLKDLNDIVNKAVAEREAQLKEAHDTTISQLLWEQAGALSKYNEEYLSQRLRKRFVFIIYAIFIF